MNRVYLIGFMGVGKSTTGRKLASRLGWKFIDTDKLFENKYKLGIDTFFSKYGEELFRKLEYDILKSTFNLNNCIISTGGGTPCHFDGMSQINNNGISIYLEMSDKAIFSRLINSKQKRPLIMNMKDEELMGFINNKLSERIPFYSKAIITVPALSISTESILEKIDEL